ncbi:HU family DNA-binding protein [uncultured Parabacteroides sp.]|uniref:HU family DNA-binding protein n=1 Tax=uncultured Parabacteroides sp. TaxID=512312 RepID=UPI00261F0B30|nr:HU family DNA-binding protein [uncultured Parabacteroides sp.]
MPQAFHVRKYFIPKTNPRQEVYKPAPFYFGTLSTQDAADQIAEESSLTKGDVLNVLDRYQRYVIKNLQKGYKVEMMGFGTVYNRFVTEKGISTAADVKATHIRAIVPGFSPSYTILNGARRYSLLGERTLFQKVTVHGTPVEEGGGSESPDEV